MTDQPQEHTSTTSQQAPKDQPASKEAKRLVAPDQIDGINEAGGVIYGKLWALSDQGDPVAELTLTCRGVDGRGAIDNFMDAVAYSKKYRLTLIKPEKPALPAPAQIAPLFTPPQSQQAPVSPGNIPQAGRPPISPPPPPQQPAPPASQGGQVRARKLEIDVRQDGRIALQFMEAGHQYADIATVRQLDNALELLAPIGGFTAAHMVRGATYDIAALITWTPGKPNAKGKPYKDIVSIEPLTV